MKIYYETLDRERQKVLPFLANFKKDFYLAGGTALALQIGHRISIDFDFFSIKRIDTKKIYQIFEKEFGSSSLKKILEDKDTLTFILYKDIKISFFYYPYPVGDLIETEYLRLASINDIACMKFSAITGRSEIKDYVDLYFILRSLSLEKLLKYSSKKYPDLDRNLILKSLVYFEDIQGDPIVYRDGEEVNFEVIKSFFRRLVL